MKRSVILVTAVFLHAAAATQGLLVVATAISLLTSPQLPAYFLSTGAFLLALGGATLREAHLQRTSRRIDTRADVALAKAQAALGLGLAFGVPALLFAMGGLEQARHLDPTAFAVGTLLFWLLGSAVGGWLGWTAGRQSPQAAHLLKRMKDTDGPLGWLLGLDYAGAAAGAATFLLWLYPRYGLVRPLWASAAVACLAALLANVVLGQWKLRRLAWLCGGAGAAVAGGWFGRFVEARLDAFLLGI